ncbi:aminotransferase class IV [Amphritea sp.]|uniref:aminotransferase class IV n=1 Tax=Amphritea sp. TaxID=1872502 RepID=UPI0025BD24E9|nr:aminotransferase class IV [Amphritea sp.]
MPDFSKGSAFIDEEYVPISEAKISLLDWGFLHSDATYDVVHVRDGKFFRLDDHLDRFFSGMKALRMSIPYTREELSGILSDCVSKSGLQDAYVEMITTRGLPEPGSRDPRTCRNHFFAFAVPFVWITPPGKGLDLIVSQRQRIPPESVNPTVKNYHWLDLVMGQFEAYDQGGETAVVVNAKGNIAEGPGFNIFAVKNRVLTTPGEGVLEGITRKTAIDIANELGYEVIQGELTPEAARSADELFATSTAGGIMAITRIDCQTVGTGSLGPITQELQDRYWALHSDPHYAREIHY